MVLLNVWPDRKPDTGAASNLPRRLRVRRRKVKTGPGLIRAKEDGMTLGSPLWRKEPLHVIPMALALVLAAFLGGALGLVWHASGFGDEREEQAEPDPAAE